MATFSDRLTQRFGKSAEVTITNKIEIDLSRALRMLEEAAIGEVQRNTMAGKDKNGAPLRPYSKSYREALQRGGESTDVDIHVTGGLLKSMKAIRGHAAGSSRLASAIGEIEIGWGDTRSEQRRFADGAAKKTGKLGPPHRLLAAWLTRTRPIGLTKEARRRLADLVRRIGVFKQR